MIYPKTPFCPMNDENINRNNNGNNNIKKDENMQKNTEDNEAVRMNNTANCEDIAGENAYKRSIKEKNRKDDARQELMEEIRQLDFAAVELNLFLDTHPNDEDALNMFVKVASSLKSLKHDYAAKYGPIYVTDSTDNAPFDWVAPTEKWPWQN